MAGISTPGVAEGQKLIDRPWVNKLFIFLAAALWGYSFVMMKGLVTEMPVFTLLAIRNALATLFMAVYLRGRLLKVDGTTVALGIGMGLFGFAAYATQTVGLSLTTPGKNAFLTGCYCVMVPFLAWLFGAGRPSVRHVLAAILCVCGIGLVGADGGLPLNLGDILTLVCAVFYALQYVLLAKWGNNIDALVVTAWQFAVMALCSGATALVFDAGYVLPDFAVADIAQLVFLALVCSCICNGLINRAMTKVDPAEGSILSAMEAPIGVLSSVLLYGELITPRLVFGFALIFVAIIVSEAGDELAGRLFGSRRAALAAEPLKGEREAHDSGPGPKQA